MKKIVGWILSTSIFAALCALALTLATERLLLHHRAALRWNDPLHLLLFGGTLAEYNVHFILNTRKSGRPPLRYWLLAGAGGLLCLAGLAAMPAVVWGLFGCVGLAALTYSAPYIPFRPKRRIDDRGITKILVLTAGWVLTTTVIPELYLGYTWHFLSAELLLRMLLIFPLCVAFDLRDYESDLQGGIQTIAGAAGERASYRIISASLISLMAAGTFFLVCRQLTTIHFEVIITSALAAYGAVRFAKSTRHPFAYTGLIDGVMLLYGLLVWLLV